MPLPRSALVLSAVLAVLPAMAVAQTTSAPKATPSTSGEDQHVVPLLTPDTPTSSMPRWSHFPVPPQHITPVSTFASRVQTLNKTGAQLNYEVAQIHWPTITPEALHAQIEARIDPSKMAPVDRPLNPEEIDALAAQLRAKAAPPPVVK